MSSAHLIFTSATALATAIRTKHLSAAEVVTAFLARIDAVNPQLNAVVELNPDALLHARRADDALRRGDRLGPLHGVPLTIKESFAVRGMRATGGTLGRAHVVADQDASAVARLRAAGAIILGTTNTPELSFSFECDNLVYGRTNNPYDLNRTPGGSSGGRSRHHRRGRLAARPRQRLCRQHPHPGALLRPGRAAAHRRPGRAHGVLSAAGRRARAAGPTRTAGAIRRRSGTHVAGIGRHGRG